jgi:addiction module HigA family antidote
MKNPPHPGEIIREEVIRPLGLSVTAAAEALGVTRQALSALCAGTPRRSPSCQSRRRPLCRKLAITVSPVT